MKRLVSVIPHQLIHLDDALIGRNEQGDLKKKTCQQSLQMFIEMSAQGNIKVLEERLEKL